MRVRVNHSVDDVNISFEKLELNIDDTTAINPRRYMYSMYL